MIKIYDINDHVHKLPNYCVGREDNVRRIKTGLKETTLKNKLFETIDEFLQHENMNTAQIVGILEIVKQGYLG